jgi:hypothetical protein
LTYHDDTTFTSYQNGHIVCENEAWVADTAVDIINKNNCLYGPFTLTDKLGGDVGYNTGVETTPGSGTRESYKAPQNIYEYSWDDDGPKMTSFMEGDELYSIFKVNEAKDPEQLSIGNFFSQAAFNMLDLTYWDIFPDNDEANVRYTALNADGDNDNHRHKAFGSVVFKYNEKASDNL